MVGVGEDDVASLEPRTWNVFIQLDDSRFIGNDDTCYCNDLITNRELSDLPPILLPSVIDRNDFMSCPLSVRAAFKRAGVPIEVRERRARCSFRFASATGRILRQDKCQKNHEVTERTHNGSV